MRVLITLRAEHAELTRLQAIADEFTHECALPDDERWRLLIILEELFTNAVTHGAGLHAPVGCITVALRWSRCRLRISFIDDGPLFDPLAFHEPDLTKAPEDRTIGGLGIHIVRTLVHQARYRREGSCNRLHLVRRIESLGTAG